jgi:hypothetical protein
LASSSISSGSIPVTVEASSITGSRIVDWNMTRVP